MHLYGVSSPRRLTSKPSTFGVFLLGALLAVLMPALHSPQAADPSSSATEGGLQIDVTKIGLGKEVVITKGSREWFMRVEVTPENSVVVRQEKDGERYLVDESETHDRSMSPAEVDAAIADFVNSVKSRQPAK